MSNEFSVATYNILHLSDFKEKIHVVVFCLMYSVNEVCAATSAWNKPRRKGEKCLVQTINPAQMGWAGGISEVSRLRVSIIPASEY